MNQCPSCEDQGLQKGHDPDGRMYSVHAWKTASAKTRRRNAWSIFVQSSPLHHQLCKKFGILHATLLQNAYRTEFQQRQIIFNITTICWWCMTAIKRWNKVSFLCGSNYIKTSPYYQLIVIGNFFFYCRRDSYVKLSFWNEHYNTCRTDIL